MTSVKVTESQPIKAGGRSGISAKSETAIDPKSKLFLNIDEKSDMLVNIEDKPFEIVPFNKHKVTTMTLVIPLTGNINLDAAFALLPITPVEVEMPKSASQKLKLPHYHIPGAILSMRYNGSSRGAAQPNKKSFKNMITIDISVKNKNLNLKLSKSNIQMCGAKSEEQAREGVEYILTHLKQLQEKFNIMNEDNIKFQATFAWLRMATKGSFTPHEIKEDDSVRIVSDHKLIKPARPYPAYVNSEVADLFLNQIHEFHYYNDFCQEIEMLRNIPYVVTNPIAIDQVHKVMVNYKYNLGFEVDRFQLTTLINGREGFYSQYDNVLEHNVTIHIPYKLPDGQKSLRKKDKVPCHTFIVYKSGIVTQSGPGEELMEGVYYKFMNIINDILPQIKITKTKCSRLKLVVK